MAMPNGRRGQKRGVHTAVADMSGNSSSGRVRRSPRGGRRDRRRPPAADDGSAGCGPDRLLFAPLRAAENNIPAAAGGGGGTFSFYHNGRGWWVCRNCRVASFPAGAPHGSWAAFAERHVVECVPASQNSWIPTPAGGREGRREGRGVGGERGGGGGRDERRRNKGGGRGAGPAADAKENKKQPKEKVTSFRRLARPVSVRFLFRTMTAEEERDQITDAEWVSVDTAELDRAGQRMEADRPFRYVTSPEGAEEAAARLAASRSKFLGFDCEWRPQFQGKDNPPKIDVLQLASEEEAFVIHLSAFRRRKKSQGLQLPSLLALLSDPAIIKGGQDPSEEVHRLEETLGWPESTVKGVLCTRYLSTLFRPTASCLSTSVALFLQRVLSKPRKLQMSNWAAAPLTDRQVGYAAMDAIASREVMVAMLGAVREREGLGSLMDGVEATRSLIDSTIPPEYLGDHGGLRCEICGDVSILMKLHGRVWGLYMLFERCLRDVTANAITSTNDSPRRVELPPFSSYRPRTAERDRPGGGPRALGRVYLPHRHRDVYYAHPSTHTGKVTKPQTLFYLAVERALHRTGPSEGECDLRIGQLVSARGPKAVGSALGGFVVMIEKDEEGRHIATCTKKEGDVKDPLVVLELDGVKREHADMFLRLILIRYLELNGHLPASTDECG